jgi:hypothetical protein
MIKVILLLSFENVILQRHIQMPFAPVPGMDLMLSEQAIWNQMTFDSVMWFDERQEMECFMSLCDTSDATEDEIIEWLTKNGWTEE